MSGCETWTGGRIGLARGVSSVKSIMSDIGLESLRMVGGVDIVWLIEGTIGNVDGGGEVASCLIVVVAGEAGEWDASDRGDKAGLACCIGIGVGCAVMDDGCCDVARFGLDAAAEGGRLRVFMSLVGNLCRLS